MIGAASNPVLKTPRLRLRPLTVDDAGFVLRLVSEPAFLANIGDKGVRSEADARRFILEGPWTQQPKAGYGQLLVELEGGTPVGICGLLYREALDITDIGFAVLEQFRGQGFASEAAAAVFEYGRLVLGVGRIVGLTTRDNLPSIRVLEKLGLSFERIVTMSEDDPGTALYS